MHDEIRPDLDRVWDRVVSAGSFVGGDEVDAFESAWAAACGVDHALGVGNGTDALVLTLRGLGIGEGDEVIVPANTFIATAEAVVLAGARPRFADVDDVTLLLTPDTIAAALTERTAAIIVVHLYGNVPDMDAITALAGRAKVAVIEDAAQAHRSSWHGRPAGSLGTVGCFSFYPGKNLGALGDGGAIVSNDGRLIEHIRSVINHGRSIEDRYRHDVLGTNSRLDALQAAVLSVKLTRLEAWNESRRSMVARYQERLSETPWRIVDQPEGGVSARHLLVLRTDRRDEVTAALDAQGIDTGIHYPVPCHRHPPFVSYAHGELPVAERAADEVMSVPLSPHMTAEQVERVCDALVGARP